MKDLNSVLPFAAALLAAVVVLAATIRRRHSIASWSFAAGMAAFLAESLFAGFSVNAPTLDQALYWQRLVFAVRSCLPFLWITFSLTYSRGNYREFLRRWRLGRRNGETKPTMRAGPAGPSSRVSMSRDENAPPTYRRATRRGLAPLDRRPAAASATLSGGAVRRRQP